MKVGNDMKRKLVTIQRVNAITPIEKADAIETAHVLGWEVVVKKNTFHIGDRVVFFAIDSFLPDLPDLEFIDLPQINPISKNTDNEQRGIRLHTVKLRGQISQGLIMSFDEIKSAWNLSNDKINVLKSMPNNEEIADILGVIKFDKLETIGALGTGIGTFPTHLTSITDEIRIQDNPPDYNKLQGHSFYMSQKIDGTSSTIIKRTDNSDFIFASRNQELSPKDAKIAKVLQKANTLSILNNFDKNIVLQGELYGPGIQKNRLGEKYLRVAIFNIEYEGQRLSLLNMIKFADKFNLELPEVDRVGGTPEEIAELKREIKRVNKTRVNYDATLNVSSSTLRKIVVKEYVEMPFNYSQDELLDFASTLKYNNKRPQEGVVIRPLSGCKLNEKISFKVINNKFLLKNQE